ncbi:DUF4357 domain-containing protein [Streptomyces sp. NBC_00525]|uniref:DUF4357 domain-containing protein n=1 Tax=Streptomyces sp. NBC_00525 TaxID=2903660 RepID=UPI002E80859F|nr:DUF4357 domain-containing protein [Streptomyces sp. NBC_00525]WUC95648.1 DUF4357 domain-containing protein [Streptomyces sp. NBC_00525]
MNLVDMSRTNDASEFYTIELVDGVADGLRRVTRKGWTGEVLAFPRLAYRDVRGELARPGVYVLVGPNDGSLSRPYQLYIGRSDALRTRMDTYQTAKAKDFWNYTFVLTSACGHPLSTAITSRLEADLIKSALDFGRAVINVNQPRPLALDGQDTRFLEEYLKHALAILLLQGAPYFDEQLAVHPASPSRSGSGSPRREYRLSTKAKLIIARGYESPHGFTVLEGSFARRKATDSMPEASRRLREQLLEEEVLVVENSERLRLTQTYTFTHPSPAASVMLGYSVNGVDRWKDEKGHSLAAVRKAETQEAAERP